MNWLWFCFIGVGLLLLDGGSVAGGAPYACPPDMPVAVAYAFDGSMTGTQAIGKTNPGVIAAIDQTAGAGNFREVDVTTSKSEPDDVDWAKAAWNALDKGHAPQWVASGPRGGWKSKALPTKAADAQAALKSIMKP